MYGFILHSIARVLTFCVGLLWCANTPQCVRSLIITTLSALNLNAEVCGEEVLYGFTVYFSLYTINEYYVVLWSLRIRL